MRPDSDSSRSDEQDVEAQGPRLQGPWWFRRPRELTGDQRHDLLAQLFFEGAERTRFLGRFAILLTLSILLATLGIAENSAPVRDRSDAHLAVDDAADGPLHVAGPRLAAAPARVASRAVGGDAGGNGARLSGHGRDSGSHSR